MWSPRTACAQPVTEIVQSPRGTLYLEDFTLALFPDAGERVTIAWLDGARDMVAAEDGVLVASTTLGFFGYTPAPEEMFEEGVFTKPLWQADVRDGAVASDGARLMALGTAPGADAPEHLVRVVREDGAWRTESTDISRGAKVLRLERANGLWVALLQRAATAEPAVAMSPRIEIWSSADGLAWTRGSVPARATNSISEFFPSDFQIAGGNGVFVATACGTILVADLSQAKQGALVWREAPQVFGLGVRIGGAAFANGEFVLTAPQMAIATSADGRAWRLRRVKPEVSPDSNGSVSVQGEPRWNITREDGTQALASADEVYQPAGEAPRAPELSSLVGVEQVAGAPAGQVAVAQEFVWLRRGSPKPEAGFFVGATRSVAANAQGVAVASERVQFAPWSAFGAGGGAPESATNLIHAVVGASEAMFLAVGVDPESASGAVVGSQSRTTAP